MKRLHINLFFILIAILLIYACYKAPVTGRNQLILISTEQENAMGLMAYQEVLKNEKISKDKNYNNAVKRVGSRIADVSNRSDFEWEFNVIDKDQTINAFALPGGKVGVYTGILLVAETDAGLATVMSHEVAHATARHGGERVSAGILAELGAIGISAALGSENPEVTYAVLQAYGLGVTVGGILPFSRTQESEADRIGLIYMAQAGYNPTEAVNFWKRMEKASKNSPKPPEFLSTHPDYGTRIENINKYLPEAIEIYNMSSKAPNNNIARK